MPGPTHLLYPHRHSVASLASPARSVARRTALPILSRPATGFLAKHPAARRVVHVALWLGEAAAFAVVISAVMMACFVAN